MDLLRLFKDHIASRKLFDAQDQLVLAVSGGADSVVLCELCHQAGFRFVVAHVNFQLRGEESVRDEVFVRQLADGYGVSCYIQKFDTAIYAEEQAMSIQEAARTLRYQWFAELIRTAFSNQPLPVRLLTAHHADDNVETVAMHFFRGTGLQGLTGIPAAGNVHTLYGLGNHLRRPLLPFFKKDILDFAAAHGLNWVEDSSNQLTKYTRNYFRHEVLPAIEKAYPQVKENLKQNIERFSEINSLYDIAVGKLLAKICRQKGNEIHIPVRQLMAYDNKALIYHIVSPYGFTERQLPDIIQLAMVSGSGRYVNAPQGEYRIIRHRHWLIISPVAAGVSDNIVIDKDDKLIPFAEGVLEITSQRPGAQIQDELVASLDAREIKYPLLLRRWKAGDYFYPLGMRKKKKIARFLIDRKLSKSAKEKVWVVEMDKKIIWVVGQRIDDRFKSEGHEARVLHISFSPV